mgnify:CR=1 FL=1
MKERYLNSFSYPSGREDMFRKHLIVLVAALLFAHVLTSSTAVSTDIQQIKVEVVGSFLFVEVYLCPSDPYVEIPTLGNPLSLIRTYPEGIYVVIENRSVAILVTQPTTCVRVSYVSEAEDLGRYLSFSYFGKAVELSVVMNLSYTVPSAFSPYPHEISLNNTEIAVFVWYNVSRLHLEYVVIPQVTEVEKQLTTTQTTTTVVTTQVVGDGLTTVKTVSSPPTQTPQTSQVSTPSTERSWLYILYLVAAVGFLIVLLVLHALRGRRGVVGLITRFS